MFLSFSPSTFSLIAGLEFFVMRASRYNGEPYEDPSQTPQYHIAVVSIGFQGKGLLRPSAAEEALASQAAIRQSM